MDTIRVSGKTVEDALLEAAIQLGTSSDNIEYTVVEEGSKGFLGLGGKKAVIEAKEKVTDEDLMKEIFDEEEKSSKKETKEYKKESKKENKKENKQEKKEVKQDKKEVKKEETVKADRQESASEKTEKPVQSAKTPKAHADPEEAKRRAESFLTDVFHAMDLPVKMDITFEDGTLSVDIQGEDMGILIGKRGQTLDSLQYLTSLVVNKGKAAYVRVKLDTEDYRARRKATLENLAKNIAYKVKKTRKPVFLEPMNPYERRIIHAALQNDPYVTTHSEGEEPYRKVVVTLRKDKVRSPEKDIEQSEDEESTETTEE